MPQNPNSITESLKATLGLDDSPACPCAIAGGVGESGHLDCCCSSGSPPPASILDLKERFSILSPFQNQLGVQLPEREVGFGGFAGFDLFGMERKMRKPASRSKQEPKICVFCRNNGAPEEVYGSHVLKTPDGRVVCPILRAYTCPLCSANGDNAHTIKYCPLSKDQPSQRPLKGGRAVGGRTKWIPGQSVGKQDLSDLDWGEGKWCNSTTQRLEEIAFVELMLPPSGRPSGGVGRRVKMLRAPGDCSTPPKASHRPLDEDQSCNGAESIVSVTGLVDDAVRDATGSPARPDSCSSPRKPVRHTSSPRGCPATHHSQECSTLKCC
ncbi:hypothetical protein FQN60_009957 [Etheostoma spectabile]|uniref:Nanos-type domain-containing protein n=1 Tax=Etheostoma spectabile TaxID=54343 RepID=A0A5J5D1P8_9PERO|nr:hypothetical protein FQN60_009957 [Etheostoma spectabile]